MSNQSSRALTPPEVADLLRATPAALQTLLLSLPAELPPWHPAPGEWCIKEVIGHMITVDIHGFGGRIAAILREERPTLKLWDITGAVRARHDCRRELQDLLAELEAGRIEALRIVEALNPEDLRRSGTHPVVGELSVADIMHEWVHHDQNHLKQIHANVQAWVWRFLGNAQRFSQPEFLHKVLESSQET